MDKHNGSKSTYKISSQIRPYERNFIKSFNIPNYIVYIFIFFNISLFLNLFSQLPLQGYSIIRAICCAVDLGTNVSKQGGKQELKFFVLISDNKMWERKNLSPFTALASSSLLCVKKGKIQLIGNHSIL